MNNMNNHKIPISIIVDNSFANNFHIHKRDIFVFVQIDFVAIVLVFYFLFVYFFFSFRARIPEGKSHQQIKKNKKLNNNQKKFNQFHLNT